MKKVLISLLVIAVCFPAAIFSSQKTVRAETIITPVGMDLEPGENYNSCDVSYMGYNIIFLTNGSISTSTPPRIYSFGEQNPFDIQVESYYLCGYDNQYFYATYEDIYLSDGTTHKKINSASFTHISNILVSSKSLFLIDNITPSKSSVYKFNDDLENPDFNTYLTYDAAIKEFAYSEVSKNSFAYDGENIIIKGQNNLTIPNIENAVEMLCDFEGNLFIFQKSGSSDIILRYSYESDYTACENFVLSFGSDTEEFISAAFNQSTGEFALLRSYMTPENDLYIKIYRISRNSSDELNELKAKTSNDILDIPDFENLKLAELPALDFYAAEISGYPSNRLYSADIKIGGQTVNYGEILEIPVGEKVLVFKTSGKFAYILYKDKFAAVYNNSLEPVSQTVSEYQAYVLLNRSKIYSCPSNFMHGNNPEYSFIAGEIEKNAPVSVVGEIEFYGVTYCYIEYGGNKSGYINKAEISGHDVINSSNPKFGRIDCNGKVPLYKDKNTSSEQLIMLNNKQEIKIKEKGDDFCFIEVKIGEEIHTGYVETKYVLEDGLTKLQVMGLWILLCTVLLAAAAILLRFMIVRKKRKTV